MLFVEVDAARFEHAADLGESSFGGGDEVEDVDGEGGGEGVVAEGQARGVSEDEVRAVMPGRELLAQPGDHAGGDVDAGDGQAARHEGKRDAAGADADFQKAAGAVPGEGAEDRAGDGFDSVGRHGAGGVVVGGGAVEGDGFRHGTRVQVRGDR